MTGKAAEPACRRGRAFGVDQGAKNAHSHSPDNYRDKSFCNAEISQKIPRITRRFRLDLTLGVKIDLRGYDEDPEMGLTTLTPCCEFHNYIPRGRYDGGDYISIELGEPYQSAEKYVVIISSVAMGGEAEKDLEKLLSKTKKFYEGAYIKEVKV